jgi:hypothetical protein
VAEDIVNKHLFLKRDGQDHLDKLAIQCGRVNPRKSLVFLYRSAAKICQCLCPRIYGHHVSSDPADKICSPEMDTTVSAGESSLVGRIMESPPAQRHGTLGCDPRLNRGSSRRECNGSAEVFVSSPQRQDRRPAALKVL